MYHGCNILKPKYSWHMFIKRKDKNNSDLAWDDQAKEILNKALGEAPVPAMLKGTVEKQLRRAAETAARNSGRTSVTAQDVMDGFLAKLPADVRAKVEGAMSEGPEALKRLQDEMGSDQK
jgi:hypothetical protein